MTGLFVKVMGYFNRYSFYMDYATTRGTDSPVIDPLFYKTKTK